LNFFLNEIIIFWKFIIRTNIHNIILMIIL
jgi:hypothetical protein